MTASNSNNKCQKNCFPTKRSDADKALGKQNAGNFGTVFGSTVKKKKSIVHRDEPVLSWCTCTGQSYLGASVLASLWYTCTGLSCLGAHVTTIMLMDSSYQAKVVFFLLFFLKHKLSALSHIISTHIHIDIHITYGHRNGLPRFVKRQQNS